MKRPKGSRYRSIFNRLDELSTIGWNYFDSRILEFIGQIGGAKGVSYDKVGDG